MTVKIVQEVTDWKVPYRQPNHVYLMSGDRVVAMSRWGTEKPEYFTNPNRIDRRGRKFVEVKQNIWRFNLDARPDLDEEASRPRGETWEVEGSKGNRYIVSRDSGRWSCTCPGHGFRGRCRHVDEVSASVLQSV
jgi:hypothetical protein